MKVVLSGYYGFHNVGDEAILKSIIDSLRKEQNNIEITVLSNDPEYTKKTYGVHAVNRWKVSEIYRAIKESNGLISGGGSLLQDTTSNKTIPYYLFIMRLAQLAGKPFWIYAQGMGPVTKKWNRWMINRQLNHAQGITVRDVESKSFLEEIGVRKPIEIVPDPVLGYEWSHDVQKEEIPTITVSVREWNSAQPFKEKLIQVLKKCANDGVKIIFIPMHGEHDYITSEEMVNKIGSGIEIFPYNATIDEKIEIIGMSHVLVGMRLHALIFAGVTNTPMIGLSYDPKIDAFLEQAHQPIIGHVDENWSEDDLYQQIMIKLRNNEVEIEVVKNSLAPLKQRARELARGIIEQLN